MHLEEERERPNSCEKSAFLSGKTSASLRSLSSLFSYYIDQYVIVQLPSHRKQSRIRQMQDGTQSTYNLACLSSPCQAESSIQALKSCLRSLEVMGNKIMSNRAFVDEKYTRPQGMYGMYDPKDGEYRKLRRLILNGQLSPCFPGAEECTSELDECPICFLFYPSLNRSRCCSKAICTECYLQIKSASFARYAQCPFCKTSSYTVEFRGTKTVEEKDFELAEEQKVIEAKIRMRQKELHDEADCVQRLGVHPQADPFKHKTNYMSTEPGVSAETVQVQESVHWINRNDDFDLNIEDTMLMEAVWLSIQEQGERHQEFALAQQVPNTSQSLPGSRSSLNATHNVMQLGELAARSCTIDPSGRGLGGANKASHKEKEDVPWETWQNAEQSWQNANCGSEDLNGWLNVSEGHPFWYSEESEGRRFGLDLGLNQSSSEAVEAGTSASSSIPSASALPWEPPEFHSSQSSDNVGDTSLSAASASNLSMSFEDQIMLAMALSLADVRKPKQSENTD